MLYAGCLYGRNSYLLKGIIFFSLILCPSLRSLFPTNIWDNCALERYAGYLGQKVTVSTQWRKGCSLNEVYDFVIRLLFVLIPVLLACFLFFNHSELKCSEKNQFLLPKESLRTCFDLRILCFWVSLFSAIRQEIMGALASCS